MYFLLRPRLMGSILSYATLNAYSGLYPVHPVACPAQRHDNSGKGHYVQLLSSNFVVRPVVSL